jgi:GntR family transcriptional regulator
MYNGFMKAAVPPLSSDGFHLVLDTNSFVPYYQQIVDHVRSLVEKKVLREGEEFLSEGDISRALKISKMPVRQAFQKLRAEGLLVIAKGKRPEIGSGRVPWNFQQLRGFSEEMRRRGLVPSAHVLSMEIVAPALEVAQALKLAGDEKVYALRRLRFVNGEPVALVTSYLPVRIFTGIEKQDMEKQSLYQVFEQVYRRKLRWAEETIGATVASEEDARVLETKTGSPLLIIRETTFDVQNVAIEFSVSLLRGDRYTASVISVRKN